MRQLALLALTILCVGIGVFYGFQAERAGSVAFWTCIAVPNAVFAVVGLSFARRDGVLKAWMRAHWGDFSRGFIGAALLFGGAYAFAKVVAPVGSPNEIWLASLYGHFGDPRELQKHPWAVAAVILLLATCEEIVWRGFATMLLEERFGSRRAWIFAAVAYALAHVPTMWALRPEGGSLNPILPIAALGAGLVWGAMARKFDRLTAGIVSHALFDWCVVMMFPLWGM